MPPSRLVAQLTFPEPGTKGQQLYGNGWSAGDRGRGGVEVGGGGGGAGRPAPPRPAASERGWGLPGTAHVSPGQSTSEAGPPPGSASSGGTFATRAPAHRHTRPRFHE